MRDSLATDSSGLYIHQVRSIDSEGNVMYPCTNLYLCRCESDGWEREGLLNRVKASRGGKALSSVLKLELFSDLYRFSALHLHIAQLHIYKLVYGGGVKIFQ